VCPRASTDNRVIVSGLPYNSRSDPQHDATFKSNGQTPTLRNLFANFVTELMPSMNTFAKNNAHNDISK
jgi:hypothetical protein